MDDHTTLSQLHAKANWSCLRLHFPSCTHFAAPLEHLRTTLLQHGYTVPGLASMLGITAKDVHAGAGLVLQNTSRPDIAAQIDATLFPVVSRFSCHVLCYMCVLALSGFVLMRAHVSCQTITSWLLTKTSVKQFND